MTEPILIVRAKGPATQGGRIPLRQLLKLGAHVQTAVERVARVLVGQADSRRAGRKPHEIARDCALDVVALHRGSFEMALALPVDGLEAMHLGVDALEKLLMGMEQVAANGEALPSGYDAGVLHSLSDMGQALGQGIDEIELESRTTRLRRSFVLNQYVRERVRERIRGPVSALRTIEGRLLMADFRHDGERCRIHPPTGDPVLCRFEDVLEDTVYEFLRDYVRVTGETTEDPATGRISSIRIRDIEPVAAEGEGPETLSGQAFWREKTLEQLGTEQRVGPVLHIEDVLGAVSDLWTDDDDFEAFLAATKGVERGEA